MSYVVNTYPHEGVGQGELPSEKVASYLYVHVDSTFRTRGFNAILLTIVGTCIVCNLTFSMEVVSCCVLVLSRY